MEKKRLLIEIPLELHKSIKTKAAQRNITIRLWITRLILEALKREELYDDTGNGTRTNE